MISDDVRDVHDVHGVHGHDARDDAHDVLVEVEEELLALEEEEEVADDGLDACAVIVEVEVEVVHAGVIHDADDAMKEGLDVSDGSLGAYDDALEEDSLRDAYDAAMADAFDALVEVDELPYGAFNDVHDGAEAIHDDLCDDVNEKVGGDDGLHYAHADGAHSYCPQDVALA